VLFSTSLANLRGDLVDPTTLYEYSRIAADFDATGKQHALFMLVAAIAVLMLSALVAWRTKSAVTAFVSGVAAIYVLSTPSCYYGSFFLLLVLVKPVRTATAFLFASAFMLVTAGAVLTLSLHGVIRLNGAAVYLPVSTLLLGILIYWLLDALKSDDEASGIESRPLPRTRREIELV
jgi:hypothetical protein